MCVCVSVCVCSVVNSGLLCFHARVHYVARHVKKKKRYSIARDFLFQGGRRYYYAIPFSLTRHKTHEIMQYCYLKSNRSARCNSVAAMISPSNVPELEEQCEAERGQHNGTLCPSCIRSCLRACKTCFVILGTYTSMPRKAKDNCARSQVRN